MLPWHLLHVLNATPLAYILYIIIFCGMFFKVGINSPSHEIILLYKKMSYFAFFQVYYYYWLLWWTSGGPSFLVSTQVCPLMIQHIFSSRYAVRAVFRLFFCCTLTYLCGEGKELQLGFGYILQESESLNSSGGFKDSFTESSLSSVSSSCKH